MALLSLPKFICKSPDFESVHLDTSEHAVWVDWSEQPNPDDFTEDWLPVYGRKPYLEALLHGSGSDAHFISVALHHQGSLVAKGLFQELRLDRHQLDELGTWFPEENRWNRHLESSIKGLISKGSRKLRVLVIGNCQVSGAFGLFFRPGISSELRDAAWSALIDSVQSTGRNFSIVLVKDLEQQSSDAEGFEQRSGYTNTQTLPVMRIHFQPHWQHFQDYLAAMGSKYRIRAKAALKKGQKLHTELWSREQFRAQQQTIMALYDAVFYKAKFRIRKVNAAYFDGLFALGEDFQLRVWMDGDTLVGFSTMIRNGSRADAHLIGLDYTRNRSHSLYLNMLYQYVADALLWKVECLDMGRTAMEIKSSVGAVPYELPVYLKMKNPLLNGIACVIAGKSAPEPWIQRHPFRTEEEEGTTLEG
jgi:hypothetical protein